MAKFLELPLELRLLIYKEMLTDPIRNGSRSAYTVDRSGTFCDADIEENVMPTRSSIVHLDYRDLWSLARTCRKNYIGATPFMYANSQLECIIREPLPGYPIARLLWRFLATVSPTGCALYKHLRIIDTKEYLCDKEMRMLVDLINLKLPNILFVDVEALSPASRGWPNYDPFLCEKDALQIFIAAAPLARLTSRPDVSVKPRLFFYFEHEPFKSHPEFETVARLRQKILRTLDRSLYHFKDLRHKAQDYHAEACKEGTYLQLTSAIRATSAETANTQIMDNFEDMEEELNCYQRVLEDVKAIGYRARKRTTILREMRKA